MRRAAAGIVFFLLCLLAVSALPSQGQVIHENPNTLTPGSSYDSDQRLMLSLQEMFGSLENIAAYVNTSDFTASRSALNNFGGSYANFMDVIKRSGISDTELQALASQMNFTRDDLQAIIDSSENYSADYGDFQGFMSSGDTGEATGIAARLQSYYLNISSTAKNLNANSTIILKTLQNTSIDTSRLEYGLDILNDYTYQVTEKNKLPASLVSDTNLTLNASDTEAVSGDMLFLTARLTASNTSLDNRIVDYYADNLWIGNATTDNAGYAMLAYTVDGRSFSDPMRLSASFDPLGANYSPAVSNTLQIRRINESARLWIYTSPEMAAYGDAIHVWGTMATATGTAVPRRTVDLFIGDWYAGNAITFNNGSFACDIYLAPSTPSGYAAVTARYDQMPGDVLMNATSNVADLIVMQDTTRLTLGPSAGSYSGGETALFQGTLYSGSGKPVAGTDVGVYADSILIGYDTTDDQGGYSFTIAVPFDISAGSHQVYAAYDPGYAKALAGSRSEAYEAYFRRAMPSLTIHGAPFFVFPGDAINISGAATINGRPLSNRTLLVNLTGVTVGAVDTDTDGSYQFSHNMTYGSGLYALDIGSPEDGLLNATELSAGTIYVMPFDQTTTVIVVLVIVALIGLAVLIARRNPRLLGRKASTAKKKPLLKPTITPVPQQMPVFSPAPAVPGIEAEIEQINGLITKGSDRRDVISNIYMAARRLADQQGIQVPESATHREFLETMSAREPSLTTPLGMITNNYETAVFGYGQLNDQDIVNALYSLKEYSAGLTGGKSP